MKVFSRLTQALAFVFALTFCRLAYADGNQFQAAAKTDFVDKTVILRHFDTGSRLHFDRDGKQVGDVHPGYWASDGLLRVTHVSLEGNKLRLSGTRVVDIFDLKKCQFTNFLTRYPVTLDLEMDPAWSVADLRALMDKVIMTDATQLAAAVPEYWKPWLGAIKSVTNKEGKQQCLATGPDGKDIPAWDRTSSDTPPKKPVSRVGGGVLPPKALFTPDPTYNQIGRSLRLQGTVVFWLVVNEQGNVQDLRIQRPYGGGLDDLAYEAVQKWRFAPATTDGTPVSVQINVEVNFRFQ